MVGVAPVVEDPAMSPGAVLHSCYMLLNGITHYEDPANPGYTEAGARAGRNGNVAVSTALTTTARSHIELWMTGPFHALGIVRRELKRVGYGTCSNAATPKWHSAGTLDVLSGLGPRPSLLTPVTFPGNGTTTSLYRFITETPNPLDFCGWTGTRAGLPVFAMLPEAATGTITSTMTGPDGPVPTCTLSAQNTTGSAKAVLAHDNAVVAVPRTELTAGRYSVTVRTAARTVSWSFTVDPQAALGPPAPPPPPDAVTVTARSRFDPVRPNRVVDTRIGLGATRLRPGVAQRFQITGTPGVAPGTTAAALNVTVTEPAGAGFVTVGECHDGTPAVSTLNFTTMETIGNAATVALDAGGGVCAWSNVATQLVVDVTGAYGPDGTLGYAPITPVRVADTRLGIPAARLRAGATLEVDLTGLPGAPAGIPSAVAMNLTSVAPAAAGFVTAWPCGTPRPHTSNLNPQPGRVRPNLAVVPVSPAGTVCLYSLTELDVVVDVTGVYLPQSNATLSTTRPFRLLDTRNNADPAGLAGRPLAPGAVLAIPIAGTRAIPADTTAVAVNVTVVNAAGAGFVTAWPCGTPRPHTSTANFAAGDIVANAAQLALGGDGRLCLSVSTATHVIVDVSGWWR
jgi:hypothetical protein